MLGIRRVCRSPLRNPPTPTPAFLIPVSFWISRTTAPSDGVGRCVLDYEVAAVQAMISRVDECLGSMLDARKVDEGESSCRRRRRTRRIHAKKRGDQTKLFVSVSVRTGRTDARLDTDPLQAPLSSNVPIRIFRIHTSFDFAASPPWTSPSPWFPTRFSTLTSPSFPLSLCPQCRCASNSSRIDPSVVSNPRLPRNNVCAGGCFCARNIFCAVLDKFLPSAVVAFLTDFSPWPPLGPSEGSVLALAGRPVKSSPVHTLNIALYPRRRNDAGRGEEDRLTVFDEQFSAVEMTLGESDRNHFCFWRFEIDICEPSRTWSHNTFHTVCAYNIPPSTHAKGTVKGGRKRG